MAIRRGRAHGSALYAALVGLAVLAGQGSSFADEAAPRARPGALGLDGLDASDTARLERGETLTFDQAVEKGGRRYVGGVTYTVIDASPVELETLFQDVQAYTHVLPRTKRAKLVGENDGDL